MRRDVASSRAAAAAELAARDARDERRDGKRRKKKKRAGGARRARGARESTKLRKLGIGKAALSVSEAALMTDKEARRVETKRKRGAVAAREGRAGEAGPVPVGAGGESAEGSDARFRSEERGSERE